jgi:hypothetical protein
MVCNMPPDGHAGGDVGPTSECAPADPTHVSRRYHEKDILAEAQVLFPATMVARDLYRYIRRIKRMAGDLKSQRQPSRRS